ncbi:MAG: sensor domain-containing diguanylate cyclase [Acidimicrobiales bacterium]
MRTTLRWSGASRGGRALALGVAISLAVAATASPVGASRRALDSTDAIVALQGEVLALVELHAFREPLPPKVQQVYDDWKSSLAGLNHDSLLHVLDLDDADGAKALGQLGPRSALSNDVLVALDRLPAASVRALEANQPVGIPVDVYEHALNDLEFRDGAPPHGGAAPAATPTTPPPTAAPVTATPATVVVASTVPIVSPGVVPTFATPRSTPANTSRATSRAAVEPPAQSPWVGIVAGALIALALAAAIVLVLRRRRDEPTQRLDDSVAQLFDASRRFGSTIETPEILRILMEETLALTDSERVAVLSAEGATSAVRLVDGSSAGLVDEEHLDRGIVRRVLDTGTAARTTGDDPSIVGGPAATLVVPLVRNGVIAGVVVASRPASRPYGVAETELLGQLVPLAAAALVSAGRHDDVAELSLTDGLTELGNRRRLDRDLVAALAVGSATVGFVMVDIDHFKHYNDTHGHVAGDEALQTVARVLRESVRTGDVVYRYGGEEFCVLLPEASGDEARDVAERLRRRVEEQDFAGAETQPGGRLTISVGMTLATRSDPQVVKERADHALYEAKHQGRNRVVVDGDDA